MTKRKSKYIVIERRLGDLRATYTLSRAMLEQCVCAPEIIAMIEVELDSQLREAQHSQQARDE